MMFRRTKKVHFCSLEAQQYHVYTLQPLSNPSQITSTSTLNPTLTQQQQEYIHEQQELKGNRKSFIYEMIHSDNFDAEKNNQF